MGVVLYAPEHAEHRPAAAWGPGA